MATTFVDYTGDGNATKAFSFPSIQESDIKVTVDEVLKSSGTHYNITSYTTTGGGNVVFTSGNIPASPAAIRIFRDTSVDAAKATYTAGSSVKAEDLNANHEQLLFAVQEEQNIVSSTQTVKGFISAADKVKLDGIETAATADQTAAEIRTLVESATDSNVFTDADHTKLNAIEAGATGDQTAAEIKTLIGNATDSNVFTDAEKTKLAGIETSATVNQSNSEIKTAYEANSNTNAFTDAEKTKLSGIATGAEVNVQADFNATSGDAVILNKPTIPSTLNDLTDVNTAGVANGKILKYDSSTSKFIIADDGGGGGGGGISDIVNDTTPQLGGNLDVQAREINTSTTNGNIKLNPNGTGVIEIKGSGTGGTLQLNCEANSHGIKLKSPPHSAAASYTLTFPNNVVNGQFLKTDASGNLSWAAVDLTALSASNLTSGTIPDARFPATLPAVSGANLTNLPASAFNILINTLSSSSGSGGGSATFDGTATRFTLSNAGSNAQAHLVSVNGVIQKPNSGTSPSEGFAIDGNDIIFASAPASGADFFILTIGKAVTIGAPSDDTVTTVKIVDDAVTADKLANSINSEIAANTAKTSNATHTGDVTGSTSLTIANNAVTTDKITDDAVTADKLANSINTEIAANTAKTTNATHTGEVTGATALTIADNVVDEANLKVSNSPTNGYVLTAQSGNTGGLTWAAASGGLSSDTEGNVVGGANAGGSFSGSSATNNTIIGQDAGAAVTTGDNNVALGHDALKTLTTGGSNTAIGDDALENNTASNNVAVGRAAAINNTTGTNITAVGYQALHNNQTGIYNTVMGYQAAFYTTASRNVAIGQSALFSNVSGAYNVAVGTQSMGSGSNASFNYNHAIGYRALRFATSGGSNTAIGYLALEQVTTGYSNHAIGSGCLDNVTTGIRNIGIGQDAGNTITTGNSNIYFGRDADASANNVGQELVFGQGLTGKGASTFYVGGTPYNSQNNSSWSTTSDERVKKNIVDNNVGLDAINQIQVKNFEYRTPEEVDSSLPSHAAINKEGTQLGVIAQEIQKVLPDVVEEMSTGCLSVNPDNLTWYLINAVKELSAKVTALEGK